MRYNVLVNLMTKEISNIPNNVSPNITHTYEL